MAQKSDIDLRGYPKQAKFFFQIIVISVNKKEKTVKGKVQVSRKFTLKSTELTINAATEERQDEEVLRDIRDADLLAKKFQVHDKCRLEYMGEKDVC